MLLNSLKNDVQKLRDNIENEGPPENQIDNEKNEEILDIKNEKGGSLAGLKKQLLSHRNKISSESNLGKLRVRHDEKGDTLEEEWRKFRDDLTKYKPKILYFRLVEIEEKIEPEVEVKVKVDELDKSDKISEDKD